MRREQRICMASKSNTLCTIVYTKRPCWTRRTKNWIFRELEFPEDQGTNKKWIHAIRRDAGKFFRITEASKICSLHFKPTDISKGLGGRLAVNTSAVPSIFAWKKTSPRKRPPPTERPYKQVQRKSLSNEFACLSFDPEILISETPEAANEIPEIGTKFNNEVTI